MIGVAEVYAKEINQNFKKLFANWEPSYPVNLGDYGTIDDKLFSPLGNILDFGISFDICEDTVKSHKQFSPQGSVVMSFHAKGSVQMNGVLNVNPCLELSFNKENTVFFNAAGCEYHCIKNKLNLGSELKRLLSQNQWNKNWVVVTDVIKAGSTTIVVAGSDASKAIIEATVSVEPIDLADSSIGFRLLNASSINYQVVSKPGIIPLIGLCKLGKKSIFSSNMNIKVVNRKTRYYGLLPDLKESLSQTNIDENDFSEVIPFSFFEKFNQENICRVNDKNCEDLEFYQLE
jgi:hypothetical protein